VYRHRRVTTADVLPQSEPPESTPWQRPAYIGGSIPTGLATGVRGDRRALMTRLRRHACGRKE